MPYELVYDNEKQTKYHYEEIPWGLPDPEYRGLGKFSDELEERLYSEALEAGWEDCGTVEDINWHVKIPVDLDLILDLHMAHFSPLMGWVGMGFPVGAILEENDRGFVGAAWYFDEKVFEEDWEAIQQAESDFFKCEDCDGEGEVYSEFHNGMVKCSGCDGEGNNYE